MHLVAEAEPAARLGSSVLGLNQLSAGTQGGHPWVYVQLCASVQLHEVMTGTYVHPGFLVSVLG